MKMRITLVSLVVFFGLAVAPVAAQDRREVFDTNGLNLTADQGTKLQDIFEHVRQQNAPLRAQLDEILGGKRFRDLTPAERDSLGPQVEPIRRQMMENRRKAHDRIHAILTPVQWQTVEQRMHELRGAQGDRGTPP